MLAEVTSRSVLRRVHDFDSNHIVINISGLNRSFKFPWLKVESERIHTLNGGSTRTPEKACGT